MAQLIVSISGIRGIVGDGLGPVEAARFGMALGTHLGGGAVVVGRDSRPSGQMIASAVQAGLLSAGCRVIDVGILSTPGVSVTVAGNRAAAGVVITASHNPAPYNGIKMLSAAGTAIDRKTGDAVRGLYTSRAFRQVPAADLQSCDRLDGAAAAHAHRVAELVDAKAIRAACLSVVVDAVNGAAGREMALLMDRLGCRATLINGEPTGRFQRPPEPVPENLAGLSHAVRQIKADAGLALDPDGDRLALVDETGRPIGEEYTLALAARHRLSQAKGPVATNLSTSRLMDDVAREAGVTLVRTPVGELNVAEAIRQNGCVIGGEGNGGVIDPRVTLVRNSLVGAALVLEMLATSGRKISELVGQLPVYVMVKDKMGLEGLDAAAVLQAARSRFADAKADQRDGLHLTWDRGWLHIRPSNTEPILRIMAEAADEDTARAWVAEVKNLARGRA